MSSKSTWGLSEDQLRQAISTIGGNNVTLISAPTGSGKSTTLIQALYNTGNPRIFVVQPRVLAARTLSQRMQQLMGADVKIGYAAEGDVKYNNPIIEQLRQGLYYPAGRDQSADLSRSTPIVYCTAGHLRRVLLSAITNPQQRAMDAIPGPRPLKERDLVFCHLLVIDEAHDRSIDVDAILAYYHYAYANGVRLPKLILMSATLGDETLPLFRRAPRVEFKIGGFEVKVQYEGSDFVPDGSRRLYKSLADAIIRQHQSQPLAPFSAVGGGASRWVPKGSRVAPPNPPRDTGSWLVFLPGKLEIELVREHLLSVPGLYPVAAHGSMNAEESMKAFDPAPAGQRKVILATNVAEMSVTFEDLSGVFDSCLEKYSETSASGGLRLKTDYASKSSLRQRMGRTGRTRPGFVHRMCSEEGYNRLPEQRPPEIARVPIESLIIEILDAGLNPITLFNAMLSEQRLQEALRSLARLRALEEKGGTYHVTDMGRFITNFPLSVRAASLIWYWIQPRADKPLFPIVSIANLIDSYMPSYFWYPPKLPPTEIKKLPDYSYETVIHEHYQRHFAQYSPSDEGDPTHLAAFLRMWIKIIAHFKTLSPRPRELAAWSREHSLNNRKIMDCFRGTRQCMNILVRLNPMSGYDLRIGRFNPQRVITTTLPLLRRSYEDRLFSQANRTNSYVNRIGERFHLDTYRPISMGGPDSRGEAPREIIAFNLAEIGTKGRSLNKISFYHPLSYDSLILNPQSPARLLSSLPPAIAALPPLVEIPEMVTPPPSLPGLSLLIEEASPRGKEEPPVLPPIPQGLPLPSPEEQSLPLPSEEELLPAVVFDPSQPEAPRLALPSLE